MSAPLTIETVSKSEIVEQWPKFRTRRIGRRRSEEVLAVGAHRWDVFEAYGQA